MAYSLGHDEQAVMLRSEAPHVLPGFVVDFVNSCEEFEPIEAHVARYAERHAWGSMEANALRSWLPRVTEGRLLVSSSDVLAWCAGHATTAPAALETIGFPTGGARVSLVDRALGSFAANARQHGRRIEFLISDNSADALHSEALRNACCLSAEEHGVDVRYAGEAEKRRLVAELARHGIPPEIMEFALFDPLNTGFSCGANRNALLLHQAGHCFCSVDDDVVCELAPAPPATARLKLFSSCDPFSRWIFGRREDAFTHAKSINADFLASHEAILGRGVGELTASYNASDLDLTQAGDDVLRRLLSGGGRVRATFSGHVGDPGIPTSVYYLFYEGDNRHRLAQSERHYRDALANRSVFALAPCVAIGDSSTSPGMAMALDHRELLPPFFPVLHAEDFTYGATLWQTVSNAFLGHSPMAVRHEPLPGKTILQPSDLGPERRAVVFEFSHLIRRVILRFQRHERAAPDLRMRQLGRHLASLGEQSPGDFMEFIRGQVLEMESSKLDHLEEELREDIQTPEWWRNDIEAYLAHVRSALTYDDFDIPFDMKGTRAAAEIRLLMRELFARYGRLLEAWPDIVNATREINGGLDWMPAANGR